MSGFDERRVVVTGLGAISPCGLSVKSTWEAMLAARSGTGILTRFASEGLPSQVAAEVKGFHGADYFGKRQVRRLGLFTQYALAASREALADAGFDPEGLANESGGVRDHNLFGVFLGTGIGGIPEIAAQAEARLTEGTKRISPFFIPRSLSNLATGQVSIAYRARGPGLCVATACAAGNHSIGEAWRAIKLGDAELAIAGGAEAALTPLGYGGFMTMKALTKNNDEATTASRPFDLRRDGFVMGEGSGVVILELLESARARGARIYCEVIGYGNTLDAHHITSPAPGHGGAARCMTRALQVAGVNPSEVDYINAHGTSTRVNDREETAAITSVFRDHAHTLAISSTKGVTGHLLGAAGGIEAVALAKTIYTGAVPPTAHLEIPDPDCDLDFVPNEARDMSVNVGVSNGFGFGGMNTCIVMRSF